MFLIVLIRIPFDLKMAFQYLKNNFNHVPFKKMIKENHITFYMKKNLAIFFIFLCFLNSHLHAAKPYVIGQLTGQLGNQFFVIAATVSVALDNDAIPTFPDLATKKEDNIPLNYEKVLHHLNVVNPKISKIYREPFYHYQNIPYSPNICLSGYFQSEKYFRHHKNEILELFKPHKEINEYLVKKYGRILKHHCTVSIHYRSYYENDPEQKFYPQYGHVYFEAALKYFPSDALLLVFSNDMKKCKKELEGLKGNFIFIEGEKHYHDLYLMSMCKHNIITNSSFSWWAAYLNSNPNKIVIVPPLWLTKGSGLNCKDVIPEDWTVINY